MVICVFGCRHGSLLVMQKVAGRNSYNLYYRLGCFLQVKWYEIRAFLFFYLFIFFLKKIHR